jgi:hypothetical protein
MNFLRVGRNKEYRVQSGKLKLRMDAGRILVSNIELARPLLKRNLQDITKVSLLEQQQQVCLKLTDPLDELLNK